MAALNTLFAIVNDPASEHLSEFRIRDSRFQKERTGGAPDLESGIVTLEFPIELGVRRAGGWSQGRIRGMLAILALCWMGRRGTCPRGLPQRGR
jgi:hypothetical protein